MWYEDEQRNQSVGSIANGIWTAKLKNSGIHVYEDKTDRLENIFN